MPSLRTPNQESKWSIGLIRRQRRTLLRQLISMEDSEGGGGGGTDRRSAYGPGRTPFSDEHLVRLRPLEVRESTSSACKVAWHEPVRHGTNHPGLVRTSQAWHEPVRPWTDMARLTMGGLDLRSAAVLASTRSTTLNNGTTCRHDVHKISGVHSKSAFGVSLGSLTDRIGVLRRQVGLVLQLLGPDVQHHGRIHEGL